MAALTIVGAGGHGRDIATIVRQTYLYTQIVLLDDDPAKGCLPTACVAGADFYILGFNSPLLRQQFDQHERDYYVVHPTATCGPDVMAAPGLVVAPKATLLTEVVLGRHVHVNCNSFMTRCTIGDYTTISPGVSIAGNVTIGARCMIGIGASVKDFVTIGDDVTVGAGAVVVEDIPDGSTVVGVPARPLVRR